jgi:UDPglucose 6-dehydrogenase
MNITIIGSGYVGLTSAVCFAKMGHNVLCIDSNEAKIKLLKQKIPTIHEHGLPELLASVVDSRNLAFACDLAQGILHSQAIILAVGTPQEPNSGKADLSFLFEAVNGLSKFICEDKVIITKSTVPVGTNQKIKQMLAHLPYQIEMVSNPEFMREGFALHDFLHPNRIIIGCSNLTEQSFAKKIMQEIYLPWILQKHQVLFTDLNTAELIKYASNAFLMTKVAFINEIDALCDKLGANVLDVAKGMGLDGRIGSAFLNPGPGIGGSCFPKDSLALHHLACENGIDLHILQATIASNQQRFVAMANKIKKKAGANKNLAVLGLAFKAGTDDVRVSPAIEIIKLLLADGFAISAYDPVAMPNAQAILFDNIKYCSSLADCYKASDFVVILTEWPEFKEIVNYADFSQKKVLDLRKIL